MASSGSLVSFTVMQSFSDLCEVKAAEDARSYYNALRPCKCMETCTNGGMFCLIGLNFK